MHDGSIISALAHEALDSDEIIELFEGTFESDEYTAHHAGTSCRSRDSRSAVVIRSDEANFSRDAIKWFLTNAGLSMKKEQGQLNNPILGMVVASGVACSDRSVAAHITPTDDEAVYCLTKEGATELKTHTASSRDTDALRDQFRASVFVDDRYAKPDKLVKRIR